MLKNEKEKYFMDKKPYIKILEIIDKTFYNQNAYQSYGTFNQEIDYLEDLFETTKFSKDYLDLDDFISFHTKKLNYKNYESLIVQYSELDDALWLSIVEVLFNIIYFSNVSDQFKIKISSFLNRYNVVFSDDQNYKKIICGGNGKFLEGSFGKVFFIDDKFVKKQLKSEYWKNKDISSRFKNEYKIQKRLHDLKIPVLDVFDYDNITNSFFMEKADLNLYDLFEKNKISFEDKINLSKKIMCTMSLAHKERIIHRDLHPGNIMIKDNKPFISDFGFAKDSNHLRSKLSTITPKPTHQFLAFEGFKNFLDLDEISDIYSIGKIIDFIFGDGNLGESHVFKLVVEKSTKASKLDRFNDVDELIKSFDKIYNTYIKGVDIKEINDSIKNGNYDLNIENYLIQLAKNEMIATQIVANKWNKLSNILLKCDLQNQLNILKSINVNFIEATGYNGWSNYDLFAKISYEILVESNSTEVGKIAYKILEECSKKRYKANDLLESIAYDKKQLLNV